MSEHNNTTNSAGTQEPQRGADTLRTLARHGAAFCLVYPWNAHVDHPGKAPIGNGWQNRPQTIDQAQAHLAHGGNVGILCGRGQVICLDLDKGAGEYQAKHPDLAQTLCISRPDAPDRAKYLYLWPEPTLPETDRNHPAGYELLSTGTQAVVAGRHASGAELVMTGHELRTLARAELDTLRHELAGTSPEPEMQQQQPAHPRPAPAPTPAPGASIRGGLRRLLADVKAYWTPLAVFRHFGKVGQTKAEHSKYGRVLRLRSNGGLFVGIDDQAHWWSFSAPDRPGKTGNGGDCVDAWHYCRTGHTAFGLDRAAFQALLVEMAQAAGIPLTGEDDAERQRVPVVLDHVARVSWNPELWAGLRRPDNYRVLWLAVLDTMRELHSLTVSIAVRELAERGGVGEATASRFLNWATLARRWLVLEKQHTATEAKVYRLNEDVWNVWNETEQTYGPLGFISDDMATLARSDLFMHGAGVITDRAAWAAAQNARAAARSAAERAEYWTDRAIATGDSTTGHIALAAARDADDCAKAARDAQKHSRKTILRLGRGMLPMVWALKQEPAGLQMTEFAEMLHIGGATLRQRVKTGEKLGIFTAERCGRVVVVRLVDGWQDVLDGLRDRLTTAGRAAERVRRWLEHQTGRLKKILERVQPGELHDRLTKRLDGMRKQALAIAGAAG